MQLCWGCHAMHLVLLLIPLSACVRFKHFAVHNKISKDFILDLRSPFMHLATLSKTKSILGYSVHHNSCCSLLLWLPIFALNGNINSFQIHFKPSSLSIRSDSLLAACTDL
jgi:hypothetical protein